MAEIDDLTSSIRSDRDGVVGLIRVTAPFDLGEQHVRPIVDEFLEAHPDARIHLVLSDGQRDLASEGFDIAFRYATLQDSDLIARRLGKNHRVICGAPAYFERRGTPVHPDELQEHDCLVMLREKAPMDRWTFMVDGTETIVRVTGRRASNHGELVRRWAIEGYGLALKSVWDIRADVRAGRLRTALERFACETADLSIVYPAIHKQSRRVQAFVAFAADHFKGLDVDPAPGDTRNEIRR